MAWCQYLSTPTQEPSGTMLPYRSEREVIPITNTYLNSGYKQVAKIMTSEYHVDSPFLSPLKNSLSTCSLILDYMQAIDGVLTQLMRRTPRENWVYIGELINGHDFKPKMDHLTCYLPGTLLLGHQNGMPDSHLLLARDLMDTCYQTYIKQPTHLAAEISYFALTDKDEHDIYVKPNDAHNLLRPEFIESLYYFYALTGNRTYQDMGWTIFQAFEKHSKVAAGYTSLGNVKNTLNTRMRDLMESFWMSETLKYFYLLFSDNRKEIDLDKWVFNSEGHPLPVYQQ